jgi:hypothetical protein
MPNKKTSPDLKALPILPYESVYIGVDIGKLMVNELKGAAFSALFPHVSRMLCCLRGSREAA